MDAVEDVKSRLSIDDVVGEYVQLKRAGRNFKGLSPFSSEKTPSFIVSPEKQIWHDFSSGKGGDMFSFVMEMEGLEFKEALELLARKAGLDLSQYQTSRSGDQSQHKERLYVALEAATRFYQVQFTKNKIALEYVLNKREFSKKTALEFRLGYAPNNGTALLNHLKIKGFTEQEIQRAGLSTKRYNGPSDMFHGRLMIPLQDPQGRVIGFTARQLDDDPEAPKYINTPQTVLYDKGRHIYGLHIAKEAIRSSKYAVLVEGNLDVIASHQAEVRQVVATAGTALTEMHLKGLQRFTADARLAFDQDNAGQAATERAIPIASKVGVSLSIINIPTGKDPDELVRNNPKAWEKAITSPQYALDWLMERYSGQLDLTTGPGKREFSDVLLPVIKSLADQVEQDHYLGRIAKLIGVSTDALRSKLKDSKKPLTRLKTGKAPQVKIDKQHLEMTKSQNQLLALALINPELRKYLDPVKSEMLISEPAGELLRYLQSHPDVEYKNNTQESDSESPKMWDYVKILSLQYEALYLDLEMLELDYEAAQLQTRLIGQYVKREKTKLAQAMQEASDSDTDQLLSKAKQLDELLSLVQQEAPRGR